MRMAVIRWREMYGFIVNKKCKVNAPQYQINKPLTLNPTAMWSLLILY